MTTLAFQSPFSTPPSSPPSDSIICDAHITQAYVISLFLEWAALFTLLLVILALVVSVASRSSKVMMREEEEDQHEDEGELELTRWSALGHGGGFSVLWVLALFGPAEWKGIYTFYS